MSQVIARTPLILKTRKTPVAIDKDDSICDTLPPPMSPTVKVEVTPIEATVNRTDPADLVELNNDLLLKEVSDSAKSFYAQNLQLQPLVLGDEKEKKQNLSINVETSTEFERSHSTEEINKSELNENLSQSPLFRFSTFDSQNFDMLMTPDDIANSSFLMGLSNVNYDIEFSDLSAENSFADDHSPDKMNRSLVQKDPFSPVNNTDCIITQPPLIPSNINNNTATENEEMATSLIDNVEIDTSENLPSPIKPVSSEYSGFSTQGWQIPSIPCHTGDYSSLNASTSTNQSATVQNGIADNVNNKEVINNDDGAVRILGGVLETLDKLF